MQMTSALLMIVLLISVSPAAAQEPSFEPVGTIGELMRDIIYPRSDEFFYVMRSPPETDSDWNRLRGSALILAESGNLLMIEGRSISEDDWRAHARELADVATVAFEATKAQDLDAILALSPRLETSCRTCHEQYHPRYRGRSANPED